MAANKAEVKAKKPWYKRWWAITIFVLLVLGVIGNFLEPSSLDGFGEQEALFTGSASDLLPTRADLPTEFLLSDAEDIMLNMTGFESGKKIAASKIKGSESALLLEYSVYKFASQSDAAAWHNTETDNVKETGGYTEVIIPDCFAWKADYGFEGETGEATCLKENVVYAIQASIVNSFDSIDGSLTYGFSIISEKLSESLNS